MDDEAPELGLVLTGGGARAAYQVGVLKGIAELLRRGSACPFPVITGTSIGLRRPLGGGPPRTPPLALRPAVVAAHRPRHARTDSLAAGDYPQPGGLSWPEFEDVVAEAVAVSRPVGMTVTICNPDLDPGLASSSRMVAFVTRVARLLATRPR